MCNKLQVDFFRIYKSATRLYSKYLLIEGCDFITSKESLQANFIALIVIGSVQFDNSCHVMMSPFRFLSMTAFCQRPECLSGPIHSVWSSLMFFFLQRILQGTSHHYYLYFLPHRSPAIKADPSSLGVLTSRDVIIDSDSESIPIQPVFWVLSWI